MRIWDRGKKVKVTKNKTHIKIRPDNYPTLIYGVKHTELSGKISITKQKEFTLYTTLDISCAKDTLIIYVCYGLTQGRPIQILRTNLRNAAWAISHF